MSTGVIELLTEKIRELELDSLIIGKQANIRYLTGFTGDYGLVVISPQQASFFTSPLYIEQAHSTVRKPFEIIKVKDDLFKTFEDSGANFLGKRTGYEAKTLTCSDFSRLKVILKDVELVSTTGIVEKLRIEKTPPEIHSIIGAQRISEVVFDEILEFIHEGMEECDLACEIDYRLRKKGGERPAFDTIVASGPNACKPHAVPSKRKLSTGDMVIIDMGTVFDGYASDMTRTVVLGKADPELKKVYGIVLEAQEAALGGITGGMKCSEADYLARDVIHKAGYGEWFVHSLGHGIGLEVHENPRISKRSQFILKKNMVVTVEPGIYIPGWGGARIEDMVMVTEDGCKNLTEAPKPLIEL